MSSIVAVRTLLGHESPDFSKRYIRSITELVGDQSLLCASHEQHKFIRRHISCLFKLDSMDSTVRKFDELVIHTLRGWEQKDTVLVLSDAMKVAIAWFEQSTNS